MKLNSDTLLKSLLEFDFGGCFIDLHNEYDCTGISFDVCRCNLKIVFRLSGFGQTCSPSRPDNLVLVFLEAHLNKASIKADKNENMLTLDNFHRGRIEIDSSLLDEDMDGRQCFYLEFLHQGYIEVLAKSVEVEEGSGGARRRVQ